MVDMKEQMSLEDYKKKVEDYLQLSVDKKESMRLMNIYEKDLNEFCSEKNKYFYSRNVNYQRLLKNTNNFKICEKH